MPILDIVVNAAGVQSQGITRMRRLAPLARLVVVAAVVGWLNYHATDDVQAVAAALLIAGFGFSFWRPRLVWIFVLVLWLSRPISGVIAPAHKYTTRMCRRH